MKEIKRQFVVCRFGAAGGQSYTYHWDGPVPLKIGDKVEVESRNGGRSTVEVCRLQERAPSFATKGVLGRAPRKLI